MTLIYNILKPSETSKEDISGNTASAALYTLLKKSDSSIQVGDCGLGKIFFTHKPKAIITDAFAFEITGGKKTVQVKDTNALAKLANAFEKGDKELNINTNPKKQAICLALIIANSHTTEELFQTATEALEKIYKSDAFKKQEKQAEIIGELAIIKRQRLAHTSSVPDPERRTHVSEKKRAEEEFPAEESPPHSSEDDTVTGRRGSEYDVNITYGATAGAGDSKTAGSPEEETQVEDEKHVPTPTSIINLTAAPLNVVKSSTPVPGSSSSNASDLSSLSSVTPVSSSPISSSGLSTLSSNPSSVTISDPLPASSSTAVSLASTTTASSPVTSPSPSPELTGPELLSTLLSNSSPIPSLSLPSSSLDSEHNVEKVKPETNTRKNNFNKVLDNMAARTADDLKTTKEAQKVNFITAIKKLSEDELVELNTHLDKVQHGDKDARLDNIRKERKFFGHGNTATWQEIRHAVKKQLMSTTISRTSGNTVDGNNKIKIPANVYQVDYSVYNQHTGRFFTHIGKTNSAKEFENQFVPELPPTPSKRR